MRDLINAALEAGMTGSGHRTKRFGFKLFEVTFDLEAGMVLIEDVLDPTEAGSQRVSIAGTS